MSRYEFEDKNCVVYADERFGEIRTVRDENGEAGMLALILLIVWDLKLRIKRLLGVRFLEK